MTQTQQRAIEFIRTFSAEHGFAPSNREIGQALGRKSQGSTYYLLKQMVAAGLIRMTPGTARSVQITASVEA